jgi:hypothetical protein
LKNSNYGRADRGISAVSTAVTSFLSLKNPNDGRASGKVMSMRTMRLRGRK